MAAQFVISVSVYLLLLLLSLGEEFKRCPAPLQSLCCWIHETKSARTLLTLTAITVNFGVASLDIVSLSLKVANEQEGGSDVRLSLQVWCDSSLAPPTSSWPYITICTHPEVRAHTWTFCSRPGPNERSSSSTVHGAEWRGRHGYLRRVPPAELRVEAGRPPVGRRPLHLPDRDAQVSSGTVDEPGGTSLKNSQLIGRLVPPQVSPPVQGRSLCGSHGDVCGGRPLQQPTGHTCSLWTKRHQPGFTNITASVFFFVGS